MELRVLKYFVAVVREGGISKAAQKLHITQPTLSRQLMDLEDELGVPLLRRSKNNRQVRPTESGKLLFSRAQEILTLAERTQREISDPEGPVYGDVYIGGGETQGMRIVAAAAAHVRSVHPLIRFHLFSGNAADVSDRMEKGLIDFGVLVGETDKARYDYMPLPATDRWGLVMCPDHPLCEKEGITKEDLASLPLLVSQQSLAENELAGWYGDSMTTLNIAATYNLLYNAAVMVREGVGCALSLDGLAGADLCFRPLLPELKAPLNIVWMHDRTFSPAGRIFLESLRNRIREGQPQDSGGLSPEHSGEDQKNILPDVFEPPGRSISRDHSPRADI